MLYSACETDTSKFDAYASIFEDDQYIFVVYLYALFETGFASMLAVCVC